MISTRTTDRNLPALVNLDALEGVPEKCPRCGLFAPRLIWQRFKNDSRHIRCECRFCGGFVCYVKQTMAAIAQADLDTTQRTRAALFDAEGAR